MKKRDHGMTEEMVTDPLDPERRKVTKMIGAITFLGMGLGVNLAEVFAEETTPDAKASKVEKPAADMGKVEKPSVDQIKLESPTVAGDKYSKPSAGYGKITRPTATHEKWTPAGSEMFKSNQRQQPMPARPGVSVVKPVPAKPGVSMVKPVPACKPGANMDKWNAVEGESEDQQNLPGTK